MPKKTVSKVEKAKEVLKTEVTSVSEAKKASKEAKKVYAVVIGALIVIAFIAGWFAFRTIFPKIVKSPETEPLKREIIPSEESLELEIKEEKPIKSFEDVEGALDELESGVGEIGELDASLEAPDIDLDNL